MLHSSNKATASKWLGCNGYKLSTHMDIIPFFIYFFIKRDRNGVMNSATSEWESVSRVGGEGGGSRSSKAWVMSRGGVSEGRKGRRQSLFLYLHPEQPRNWPATTSTARKKKKSTFLTYLTLPSFLPLKKNTTILFF